MLLTSLNRVRNLLEIKNSVNTTDNFIKQIIHGVSSSMENFLNRNLEKKLRTQFFNVDVGRNLYNVDAYPIDSVTDIFFDTLGLFTGGESQVDTSLFNIPNNSRTVNVFFGTISSLTPSGRTAFRALRIKYTGGAAETATTLVLAVGSPSGTFVVGETVTGGISGAVGTVLTLPSAGVMNIEVVAGVFDSTEIITGLTSGETITITALTTEPLAHTIPEIVHAVELQALHLYQRRKNIGNTNMSMSAGSVAFVNTYELLRGVKDMIRKHRRIPLIGG